MFFTVTLGFFDDINIPPENLQPGSKFNEDEQVHQEFLIRIKLYIYVQPCQEFHSKQVWVWEYATEDDTHELFMDINEDIRFKVVEETFFDTTPSSAPSSEPRAESSNEETKTKIPYSIKVSIESIFDRYFSVIFDLLYFSPTGFYHGFRSWSIVMVGKWLKTVINM